MKRTCRLTFIYLHGILGCVLIGLLVSSSWIHLENPVRFRGGLYKLSEPIDHVDKVSYFALQNYFCNSEEVSSPFPKGTIDESCEFFTRVMISSSLLVAMQTLALVCLFVSIISLIPKKKKVKLWQGPLAGTLGYLIYIVSLLMYFEQNSLTFQEECNDFDTICAGHSVIVSLAFSLVFFFIEILHGLLVAKHYYDECEGIQGEQETQSGLSTTNIDIK